MVKIMLTKMYITDSTDMNCAMCKVQYILTKTTEPQVYPWVWPTRIH